MTRDEFCVKYGTLDNVDTMGADLDALLAAERAEGFRAGMERAAEIATCDDPSDPGHEYYNWTADAIRRAIVKPEAHRG